MARMCGGRKWTVVLAAAVLIGGAAGWLVWQGKGPFGPRTGGTAGLDDAAGRLATYRKLCDGKVLAGQGKHAEALAIFDDIVRRDAGSPYAWDADIQAAHSMGYLGRSEEALTRLDRIIAQCPLVEDKPKARLVKADVFSLGGKNDLAANTLEEVIAEFTEARPWICEEALLAMIPIYHRTRQYALVRAAMDRIIADYPGSENSRRIWAEREESILRDRVSELRRPIVDQRFPVGYARRIKRLDDGLTRWTAEGGPYWIEQPISLSRGATLRIEAGTTIRFGLLGELQVAGTLEALGTAEKPVQLLPLGDDATQDWWVGMALAGNGAAARLTHCRFVGAEIAVDARDADVQLDHCTFEQCGRATLRTAGGARLAMTRCKLADGQRVGVECEPGSRLEMAGCTLSGLKTDGIVLRGVSAESFVRDCDIERCGGDGVVVRGRGSVLIENCRIRSSGKSGIVAVEAASPSVLATRVEGSAAAGIRLAGPCEGTIKGCQIVGNRGGGVVAAVRYQGQIAENVFENNGAAGLHLRLDCSPAITRNRFVRNRGPGLLLEASQPSALRDNQFIDNTGAALRNDGSATIQAPHNWWGSPDEQEIQRVIEDRRDKPDRGEVEFRPWTTTTPE